MKYADVVIDNKTDHTDQPYTYACGTLDVRSGDKVYVPFARSRNLREGYVLAVSDQVGEGLKTRLRTIDHVDGEISLSEESIRTAVWMRDRYVCRYIDALRCFTPVGHRRKRQTAGSEEEVLGIGFADEEGEEIRTLTEEQSRALAEITEALDRRSHSRFLLYGVTGSGKTEVYIRAVRHALEQGRTAIVLVPEISLTPQIIERFSAVFGEEQIAVIHSRLTSVKRFEQWQRIRSGQVRIVIGARSAVFAPVKDLGLIVVDEEHESTYKSDSTPKYDTIEVAIKRLSDRDHQGVLLLGSATPSIATFGRAKEGIYRTLPMRSRYNEAGLPQVSVVDMRAELREGNRSMLSRALVGQMQAQLEAGRQVMLLQNRRGYSTFVSCRECGHVAVCPTCGLSLTYHRNGQKLSCHYCGHEQEVPEHCPECSSRHIRFFGSGTEKIEETVREMFPGRRVDRIDLDSVRRKGELNRRLKAFGRGQTDILIGTQMIAKGLDFKNVGMVGIVAADLTLNIPDYRSPERAFQLITQAAGRAGRGSTKGTVVIQTYNPEHYAIGFSAAQDYDGFFAEELAFRRLMDYPPFGDMIQVLFTADSYDDAAEGAQSWYERLCSRMPAQERQNILPPQQAYMGRIRDTYRFSMVIRCPKGKRREYTQMLRMLKEADVRSRAKYLAVVDINPYSFA
ncbi:MAG: primosomal protein N' [Firmicutes bacterium]|nr:primosomal protein N' [Bacillota bacterium]